MDQKTLDKVIPITDVDRLIGTYTGGINTGKYYEVLYGSDAGGQVPVDTLIIEDPRYTQGTKPGTQQQTRQTSQTDVSFLSPVDSSSGTDAVTTTPTAQANKSVETTYTASTVQNGSQTTQTKTQTNDGGFVYSVVNAAFSIAVVISIMGLIAVVYIIIRTRQLHHHEHDVRHAGDHGHGGGHGGGHGAADAHPPAAHGNAADAHAPSHDAAHAVHDTAGATHTEDHAVVTHDVTHDTTHADDDDGLYEFETPVPSAEDSDRDGTDAITEQSDDVEEGLTTEDIDAEAVTGDDPLSRRWRSIQQKSQSHDMNDLRFAFMDLDLVLEDALRERGVLGDDLKAMLNSKEAEDLATYQIARDAHQLHEQMREGSVALSQSSLRELVALYTKVFKELQV